jgi:hypothetical protein
MRARAGFIASSIGALVLGAVALSLSSVALEGQTPAGQVPKTPWGAPDLQGIWTDPYETPLQRPAQFAGKEQLTKEEIAAIDAKRASLPRREYRDRDEKGQPTEQDVAGAYNSVFNSFLKSSGRTALIVDPPDGRIPALTAEAQKRREAYREFQLALMQNTDTCKKGAPSCRGGKYGPVSPLYSQMPPIYNTDRLNRSNGPEDRSMSERCMAATLPDFSGYRRIVQGPDAVSMFYDTGQGQGWMRVIPISDAPHAPSNIRRWWGDSRARWEGNTLVVDVTNFTPKLDFRGARENLHIVERFTRVDADTLTYEVTIEDPTTWVRPWTVRYDMVKQDDGLNRIYYEPRCHDGNYGLAGMLSNTRAEERDYAAGKGPHPASRDTATGGAGGGEDNRDPLAGVD